MKVGLARLRILRVSLKLGTSGVVKVGLVRLRILSLLSGLRTPSLVKGWACEATNA